MHRLCRSMEDRVWVGLPTEILERVVAFLPLPSLSRFRCVSKRFHAWIFSAEFFEVCVGLPLQRTPLFVCRSGQTCCLETSVGERMFNFVAEYVTPYHTSKCRPSVHAAFGGYALISCGKQRNKICNDIVVDLVSRKCTVIPIDPFWHLERQPPWYGIVVDRDKSPDAFKVLVLQSFRYSWQLHIYDPLNGRWKQLYLHLDRYMLVCWHSCAILLDHLVVVFSHSTNSDRPLYEIFSISIQGKNEGKVVNFQRIRDIIYPRLVTDGQRLFLVGLKRETVHVLEINQPNEPNGKYSKVFQISLSMKKKTIGSFDFIQNLAVYKDNFFVRLNYDRATIYDLKQRVWRDVKNLENPRDMPSYIPETPPAYYCDRLSLFLAVGESW